MSMAAGQSLMMKLGTAATSAAIKGAPESAFEAVLKAGGMSASRLFALKIESGEKKDWLIKEAVEDDNPIIINPNPPYPPDPEEPIIYESPITFESESAAENYIINNNLHYVYSDSTISDIIVFVVFQTTPGSNAGNNEMAKKLAPACKSKNDECWNGPPAPTGRPPTPLELKTVIEEKIMAAG